MTLLCISSDSLKRRRAEVPPVGRISNRGLIARFSLNNERASVGEVRNRHQ